MRVRADDLTELRSIGSAEGRLENGLVFAPARGITEWDHAEDELAEAFVLTRQATIADAPVVYVLDARAVLGRAAPLDSAVAAGLVGGARALAFEGLREQRYVTVIAVDGSEREGMLADAVRHAVSSRTGLGQVQMLGSEHVGAMLP
ncbi:MAG: hypothetical protein ACRDNL_08375 [Spirillospora sp.]